MTEYERKIYMLGLSVMSRLKRDYYGDMSQLDTSVLDSIIYDAIELDLIEVSDKGEIIFQ